MTKGIKPEDQAWRRRVEGQIRHTMNEHPEWFNVPTEAIRDRCIRSMGKRIIGEIVAGTPSGANQDSGATVGCSFLVRTYCVTLDAIRRMVGGTVYCSPSDNPRS